ncbi:hypothetical protein F441_13955 [Phytophthora nicotianae CJ01A1]|uniref:Uncharacterized protein n=3 Tax=Phytophthora nicotianae TaxID=4792 RepID=V9EN30_PHYNI|nr:hypothetical protein F443_14027 [Phytophthora nicotianae P1569]ETK80764.1 hypothetical protein L915_13671 [Phytophthora nicotianae]ETL34179.1 hypothetical protein L916_13570 [Phytophthora nicotianae]ETP10422.1 hypothetical protein F441_13955 [Phytophthora nicotianae CJ01A1]
MAGRGRGRANTLPAWMTKQGLNEPPAGPLPESRPPPPAEGPPPRNGQFDDAPEPNRGPMTRNDIGVPSGGKRRSRSRDRGNGPNGNMRGLPPRQDRPRSHSRDRGNGPNGDARGPPPRQDRPRSRSRDRGNGRDRGYGYDADRRREDPYRCGPPRGRSRSRSRERQDYRGDYRRGGDRYENRGYGYRGPRNDGRPMRREEEAMERGYRRPAPNGHDDRTSRRYASDYQP